MRRTALFALAPLAASLAMPASALAQPALVTATPAANATVSPPTRIALNFSEPVAAASGLELTMTAMPGMADHPPMPIRGFTLKVEAKVLSTTLPRPLPAGTYLLKWHATGPDQKRAEGNYSFTVR